MIERDETTSLTHDDRKVALVWLSGLLKNNEYMVPVPKTALKLLYSSLSGQPEVVRCERCAHCKYVDDNLGAYCDKMKMYHDTNFFCADGTKSE